MGLNTDFMSTSAKHTFISLPRLLISEESDSTEVQDANKDVCTISEDISLLKIT